jgi:hypothetical protein
LSAAAFPQLEFQGVSALFGAMARRDRTASYSRRRRGTTRVTGVGTSPQRPGTSSTPEQLIEAIRTQAAFRLSTSDGVEWIDPYQGQAVPITGSLEDTALHHLTVTGLWRDSEPMALSVLKQRRWLAELNRRLPNERRFRLFSRQGGWLNPYTAELVDDVPREDGGITARTIIAMARHLAECLEAEGPLLRRSELKERMSVLTGFAKDNGDKEETSSYMTGPQDDLDQAGRVQAHMLADLPALPGWELALHFEPHSSVSGDCYDVHLLEDGRLQFLFADVSGHGIQAALVVARCSRHGASCGKTAQIWSNYWPSSMMKYGQRFFPASL